MKTKNLNKHSVEIRVYRKESSLLVLNQTGVLITDNIELCADTNPLCSSVIINI